MITVLEIIVIVAVATICLSYIVIMGSFIWYHNELFNYVLYDRVNNDEPLNDEIDLAKVIEEYEVE